MIKIELLPIKRRLSNIRVVCLISLSQKEKMIMKRNLFSISIAIILALGLWWALPTQKALAATCTWTGNAPSTAWADGANWSGCGINNPPQATDSVVIPVVVGANYPTITTAVTIVDIQIDPGASLTVSTGGSLDMDGNLLCNGTFTATGRPTTFSGTANQTVSGNGTTTFGTIAINNTGAADNNIVEIMPSSFNADVSFLTLTQGILKLSGSYTLSNSLFNTNNYIIWANAGIWLNNPNVTITAAQGSSLQSRLRGSLRITAGTYYVGDAVNKAFLYETGSSLLLEGGALIVAGTFAGYGSTDSINFTMNGGTFTVGTIAGYSSGGATFSILGTSSNVVLNGGTIIIQNENTGTGHGYDFRVTPGSASFTGGTVQFGNSLTSDSSPSFELGFTLIPSLLIFSNGTNTPSVVFYSNLTVYGNLTIDPSTTLNTSGYNLTVSGNATAPGNWTNNGTFITTAMVTLSGTAQQTIGGTSTTTFYFLVINNTTSGGVVLASSPIVNNNLEINSGSLFNWSTYDITVAGTLTNNGMLRQTKIVNGTSPVYFFNIVNYGGLVLNANNTPLGTTTVSIWGNHDCTNVVNETVKRCFYINPENQSGRNATITFYFANSEIVGSNSCTSLNAYHFSAGWGSPLTFDGRDCATSPRSLRVINVDSFSPFAIKSAAPTVIELRNLTAQSNARISVLLLAVAFGFLVAGGGLLYLRRRKVQ